MADDNVLFAVFIAAAADPLIPCPSRSRQSQRGSRISTKRIKAQLDFWLENRNNTIGYRPVKISDLNHFSEAFVWIGPRGKVLFFLFGSGKSLCQITWMRYPQGVLRAARRAPSTAPDPLVTFCIKPFTYIHLFFGAGQLLELINDNNIAFKIFTMFLLINLAIHFSKFKMTKNSQLWLII